MKYQHDNRPVQVMRDYNLNGLRASDSSEPTMAEVEVQFGTNVCDALMRYPYEERVEKDGCVYWLDLPEEEVLS